MLDTGSPSAARMPRAPSHRAGVQERLRIRASECGAFGAVPAYVMCTRQATKKIAGACFRDAGLGRRSRTLWRGSDREQRDGLPSTTNPLVQNWPEPADYKTSQNVGTGSECTSQRGPARLAAGQGGGVFVAGKAEFL